MPGSNLSTRSFYEELDRAAFYVYIGELLLRMISYGPKPWEFFKRSWNIFDFCIIALSPIFAGQIIETHKNFQISP